MREVVITNPVINAPFDEPTQHFRFDDEGITEEIVPGRRVSSYFMPIAGPKKKQQLALDIAQTRDRLEENVLVNKIRGRVDLWRKGGYISVTRPPASSSNTGPIPSARSASSSAKSKRWRQSSI